MIVSFTGTQSGMTDFQKKELAERLEDFDCTELVHGDCIGADEQANSIALGVGIRIFTILPSFLHAKRAHCFPVFNDKLGAWLTTEKGIQYRIFPTEAPLIRNKKIVDASDTLIACPKEHAHTLRSGTWATVRYAWRRKKNVIVIPPIVREEI